MRPASIPLLLAVSALSFSTPGSLEVLSPVPGSIFPPEIGPPLFLWRDPSPAASWRIVIDFGDGAPPLQADAPGSPPPLGDIDPRASAPTNQPPGLHSSFAGAHSWRPNASLWAEIKRRSRGRAVSVTIAGLSGVHTPLSSGVTRFSVSTDPVGAPIFYRDVPLMPSETQKGVIKPLAPDAIPLVQWRLRDIAQPESRIVLRSLPTCANCHSFSAGGKTLGMDLDGPDSDKGTYAIASVAPKTVIRREDVITWNSFPGRPPGSRTIGFMSQISPDGQHAVTTLNEEVYTANFRDYRFLQVFYPTRGILAVYSRSTGRIEPLPGADDPRYVHTNAVWSPDGHYLVFARAAARDPYPPNGGKMAAFAGSPAELPLRYDLYRIPFNGGRGGHPQPIPGASANGRSNSFPKISPDGRWLVYVQSANGLLMRPDSQLFIVPAAGGTARRMNCNTPLMNSWHSFSPNGRWMVFSSKSRSPYTQLFLTHIDDNGNDSPAILLENSTAANRAANIPEFVDIPPSGLLSIEVPAADFYRLYDEASQATRARDFSTAVQIWTRALALEPGDPRALNNLGVALAGLARDAEAADRFRAALAAKPSYAEAHYNLGAALARLGRPAEAAASFERAFRLMPDFSGDPARAARDLAASPSLSPWRQTVASGYNDRGIAAASAGRLDDAETCFRQAIEADAAFPQAHYNLGRLLARQGKLDPAAAHLEQALDLNPSYADARFSLASLEAQRHRWPASLAHWQEGLRLNPAFVPALKHAAWILATASDPSLRDAAQAVRYASEAVRRTGSRDPEALDALAAALAEAGRFTEAAAAARQAITLAPTAAQPGLHLRLAAYEASRPWREPAISRASQLP